MELKNYYVQDAQGNVVANPIVYLYQPGTETLVTGLQKPDGTSLTNPFTGTSQGLVQFAAQDGVYDLRITAPGRDTTMRVQFNGLTLIKQATTGNFYAEDGANIQRLADRVFVGAAGANYGTNNGNQPDWLTQYMISQGRTFSFPQLAQFCVLSSVNTQGQNAIVTAARTSDLAAVGGSIGAVGVAVNDNTNFSCGAWGFYSEGIAGAGCLGATYAAEFETIGFSTASAITPYAYSPTQLVAIQIASGGEFTTAHDASAAINIQANGAKFLTGINFGADAITGSNGDGSGTSTAIQFACGHALKWYGPGGSPVTQIFGTTTNANYGATVVFSDGSTQFLNSGTGKGLFAIGNLGPSGVNYIQVNNAATGNSAEIAAGGDDTNVGVRMVPKGNGRMSIPIANVPNYANDAAAAAGGLAVGDIYRNGSVLMIRAA